MPKEQAQAMRGWIRALLVKQLLQRRCDRQTQVVTVWTGGTSWTATTVWTVLERFQRAAVSKRSGRLVGLLQGIDLERQDTTHAVFDWFDLVQDVRAEEPALSCTGRIF